MSMVATLNKEDMTCWCPECHQSFYAAESYYKD